VLDDARLVNPNGYALCADGIAVGDGMFCQGKFKSVGEVRLLGAHIKGQLSFNGGELIMPHGYALNADGLIVTQGVFCQDGFIARGEISLVNSHITGQLGFEGATLTNAGSRAVRLQDSQIDSLWINEVLISGAMDLSGARLNTLYDNPSAWPARIFLDGLVYERLHPYRPAAGKQGRLAWLNRNGDEYRPQPYERLAASYRALGHDEEARKVLLAKSRHGRSALPGWGKATGWILDGLVGYGYRPMRAIGWMVVLVIFGSLYFSAYHPTPANPSNHPHFQPVLYSINLILPIINIGQSYIWYPTSGGGQLVATAIIVSGWVLAIAVVAGITRILTRN
jgi:hypothetical protein